ncbi:MULTISPECIES: hypothetical protein [unclassified Cyanobium]|uniref:hypothetical protein n=1 Tax=unclassified Cyanobium TaxID=2627006 RepID=UPI0020CEF36B|nr:MULTISPECIES: hypothetical protein [unclassified Cyanobium]
MLLASVLLLIGIASGKFSARLGVPELVLILFDGGLRTSLMSVRRVWRQALSLSTVGV